MEGSPSLDHYVILSHVDIASTLKGVANSTFLLVEPAWIPYNALDFQYPSARSLLTALTQHVRRSQPTIQRPRPCQSVDLSWCTIAWPGELSRLRFGNPTSLAPPLASLPPGIPNSARVTIKSSTSLTELFLFASSILATHSNSLSKPACVLENLDDVVDTRVGSLTRDRDEILQKARPQGKNFCSIRHLRSP